MTGCHQNLTLTEYAVVSSLRTKYPPSTHRHIIISLALEHPVICLRAKQTSTRTIPGLRFTAVVIACLSSINRFTILIHPLATNVAVPTAAVSDCSILYVILHEPASLPVNCWEVPAAACIYSPAGSTQVVIESTATGTHIVQVPGLDLLPAELLPSTAGLGCQASTKRCAGPFQCPRITY